jgi:ParB-like chromosome segregation protein Spo0J
MEGVGDEATGLSAPLRAEAIMDIRNVPVEDLVLDPNLNLRDKLDDFTVERYIEAWERLPPVTVFEVEGRWLLADGFHRHAAVVKLGRRMMPAEIRQGTFSDALDFVAGVNLFHGLPLTRSERRRAVEVKLRLHHDWSDRRLSEELGASRELIAKTRKMLIDGGQVPASSTRIGADGKTYPSAGLPKDPNEHLPKGRPIAQQDEPREKVGREPARSPVSSILVVEESARPVDLPSAPWDDASAKAIALAPPVAPVAPTIDEMLSLMTNQIMDIINWTKADGFHEAYKTASANTRGLFDTAVIRLAARAGQLRKS